MNTKLILKDVNGKVLTYCALLLVLLAGITSCVDDEYDLSTMKNDMVLSPQLAIPIGTVKIELSDLLSNYASTEYLKDSSDGSMTVIYEQDLQSFSGESKIYLPDQDDVTIPAFGVFPTTIPASGEVSRDTTLNLPIKFIADQRIDSMLIKTFVLNIIGTSTYPSNINQVLTIIFDDMKKGGVKYNEAINITQANFSYLTNPGSKGADYLLQFATVNSGVSLVPITMRLTLKGPVGTPINPLSRLDFKFKIDELRYKLMYGYIGQTQLLSGQEETMDISFLGREMGKNITWYNPQISIVLKNSYAVPVNLTVENLSVYSKVNEKFYNTNPDNTADNPKSIKHPYKAYQYENDQIPFTKKNGYLKLFEAIEKYAPQSLTYKVTALSNPDGPTANYNILMDTSTLVTKLHFKLPICFRSPGFGQSDTMEFDMFSRDDTSETTIGLKSMIFTVASDNGMPIDMNLQVYFTNANYVKLDSLFNQSNQSSQIVKAGKIDVTGKVVESTKFTNPITFDDKQLKKLESTKYLIYKVTMATAEYSSNPNMYVKFIKGDVLKLTFACDFQPIITIKDKE